jgi:hypothetical protein
MQKIKKRILRPNENLLSKIKMIIRNQQTAPGALNKWYA